MSNKPSGGPAFPVPERYTYSGMSLRDYFAGQALAGMADWGATDLDASTCAARAYALADAMLAERAK